MIFKTIKLQNFRQYQGENTFEFSSGDKPITLLIGENGTGKTTFVEAFKYCFYGHLANNKYFNLPDPNELLSHGLIHNNDGSTNEDVSVEVRFEHNNIDYIMKRTNTYSVSSGISLLTDKQSTLSISSKFEGYKTLENDEADLEMDRLLPAGLSHVFMFDGERMERQIDSKQFKEELKESILGILNLKKYDALINHLGRVDSKSSVIGRVYLKATVESFEAKKIKRDYEKSENTKQRMENDKITIMEKINALDERREILKNHQSKIEENADKLGLIEGLELQNRIVDRDILRSEEYLVKTGLKLLEYKLLLQNKDKFDSAVANAFDSSENFYQYLHVSTIEDILERHMCLCGREVGVDSIEENKLHDLKKIALPQSNAQNINLIQSLVFNQVYEYKELLSKFKKVKDELTKNKAKRSRVNAEIRSLQKDIKLVEGVYGENAQENLDDIDKQREDLTEDKIRLQTQIDENERQLAINKNEFNKVLAKDSHNNLIGMAVSDLEEVRSRLIEEKKSKEQKARSVLAQHFNNEIQTVMNGRYSSNIDENYGLHIKNLNTNVDETKVISTGQSVVVSLSFIKSLILTAKELSDQIDGNNVYGVIMDAAMSNLDEQHVMKVSESNLLKMDQLIFLSFKRQLRDEMYSTISKSVGNAYVLEKRQNSIKSTRLLLNEVEDFIKFTEDENEKS